MWAELPLKALISIDLRFRIIAATMPLWQVAGAGFLVFIVALGSGANSFLETEIGQWFRKMRHSYENPVAGNHDSQFIIVRVSRWLTRTVSEDHQTATVYS